MPGTVMRRLPDSGRHLHPRLDSRVRSRARALRCAGVSARRWRLRHAQLRLRPRFLRARGDRDGKASLGRRLRGRICRPAGRGPGTDRGGFRPCPFFAQMAPLFDDLRTIVCHALAWERKLLTCAVDFRRYSWRLQPVFEAELLGPTRAQIEVLEPPAHLLACHRLCAAPLLPGGSPRRRASHYPFYFDIGSDLPMLTSGAFQSGSKTSLIPGSS